MKIKTIISILLIVASGLGFAQENPVHLMGESNDGKTLKLLWLYKVWDHEISGFNVMRRNADKKTEWEKLNRSTIVPFLAANKDLSNVEPDESERSRIKKKLQNLIADGKVRESSPAAFTASVKKDQKVLMDVSLAMMQDFDLALCYGFALADRSAPKGVRYEYGVFIQREKLPVKGPVATFAWSAGEITVPSATQSNSPGPRMRAPVIQQDDLRDNRVSLSWTYPDTNDLVGFRIYQNGVVVSNEFQSGVTLRTYISGELREGTDYRFTVQAVGRTRLESDQSTEIDLVVPQTK